MAKNIDIIFVDIDWTILSHYDQKHVFDYKSIRALKKAQKKGVLVYICTARAYHSVEYTGLFKLFKPDGLILSNGGLVFVGDKVIKEINYSDDKLQKVIKDTLDLGLVMQITEGKSAFFTKEKNEYVDHVFSIYQETYPKVEEYKNRKGINAIIFAPTEYDEKLNKLLPKGMSLFRFYDYALELIEKEHIKGEAVEAVLNYLGLSKDRTMTIGDDLQDISMFETSKYSVFMANGKQEVKPYASFVTKPIEKHGVRYALKHYKVI